MAHLTDYAKAYETAKQELTDMVAKQREIERRIVIVRQSLQTLATLCESEGIRLVPSVEASYLLDHSSFADEIRAILKSSWPAYLRPNVIKGMMESLGHDLTKYENPQATIHMVLKRMAGAGEVQEGRLRESGKKAYRLAAPQTRNQRATSSKGEGRFNGKRFGG